MMQKKQYLILVLSSLLAIPIAYSMDENKDNNTILEQDIFAPLFINLDNLDKCFVNEYLHPIFQTSDGRDYLAGIRANEILQIEATARRLSSSKVVLMGGIIYGTKTIQVYYDARQRPPLKNMLGNVNILAWHVACIENYFYIKKDYNPEFAIPLANTRAYDLYLLKTILEKDIEKNSLFSEFSEYKKGITDYFALTDKKWKSLFENNVNTFNTIPPSAYDIIQKIVDNNHNQ